jgi:hypothetical protein
MSRSKRTSSSLEQASLRCTRMRSLNSPLEFSDGMSLADYETRIQRCQAKLNEYNTLLSTLDEAAGQLDQMERELRTYSGNMLANVGIRYGKQSLQYMQAGGKVRKPVKTRSAAPVPMAIPEMPLQAVSPTTNGKGIPVGVN